MMECARCVGTALCNFGGVAEEWGGVGCGKVSGIDRQKKNRHTHANAPGNTCFRTDFSTTALCSCAPTVSAYLASAAGGEKGVDELVKGAHSAGECRRVLQGVEWVVGLFFLGLSAVQHAWCLVT